MNNDFKFGDNVWVHYPKSNGFKKPGVVVSIVDNNDDIEVEFTHWGETICYFFKYFEISHFTTNEEINNIENILEGVNLKYVELYIRKVKLRKFIDEKKRT